MGCFMDPVPLSITSVTCLTIFEEMVLHLDIRPRTTFRSLRTTLQPSSNESDKLTCSFEASAFIFLSAACFLAILVPLANLDSI
ncbi:hypothetical protein EYF80_022183 [Liparis tanakae]|uniref:Uncharacterized protein n=1 Tax=Liparis tanakae TaxID=230148 RepID=A0A4Z2HRI6_9TELE|nr:hypothetical protein EYF80_022183 [Liparis tanakae]